MKTYWPYPFTMCVSLFFLYLALWTLSGWRGIVFAFVVLVYTAIVFIYTDILNILRK